MKIVSGRCRECHANRLVHIDPRGDGSVASPIRTTMADIEMEVTAAIAVAAEEIWETYF